MSVVQCAYANVKVAIRSLFRLITWQSDPQTYLSRAIGHQVVLRDQPGRHFIYTRTIQSEITALCNLGLFAILAQCTAYVLGFIVIYLTLKKLVGRWRPSHEVQKNDSQLIDEEEVELYTIDSIDEFEKLSKSDSSNEEIADSREKANKRQKARYEGRQDMKEASDTESQVDGSSTISNSNQDSSYSCDAPEQLNIYSVLTQPLSSFRTILSQMTPNFSGSHGRSNSTDDDKVNMKEASDTESQVGGSSTNSNSNQDSSYSYDAPEQLNIYSVLTQPLSSFRTILSQMTPNFSGSHGRSNSTDDDK
ncbi:lisH domain-containing protein C1711.05-like, partial [Diaphorina citri]|uniref:LisH domain-containing protein C1711.05-like n=1 Tax=Diaphorina citri TaxID=121845 RepID=A0A3Q0J7B9_DIACI